MSARAPCWADEVWASKSIARSLCSFLSTQACPIVICLPSAPVLPLMTRDDDEDDKNQDHKNDEHDDDEDELVRWMWV